MWGGACGRSRGTARTRCSSAATRQARTGRRQVGEASTRSPRLAFGAVTNLCDATSALTVEGDLPSSLAISLHEALRSSILWTVSRSCLVSLPEALGTAFSEPFFLFRTCRPPDLPGPAGPALKYQVPIHHMCG